MRHEGDRGSRGCCPISGCVPMLADRVRRQRSRGNRAGMRALLEAGGGRRPRRPTCRRRPPGRLQTCASGRRARSSAAVRIANPGVRDQQSAWREKSYGPARSSRHRAAVPYQPAREARPSNEAGGRPRGRRRGLSSGGSKAAASPRCRGRGRGRRPPLARPPRHFETKGGSDPFSRGSSAEAPRPASECSSPARSTLSSGCGEDPVEGLLTGITGTAKDRNRALSTLRTIHTR